MHYASKFSLVALAIGLAASVAGCSSVTTAIPPSPLTSAAPVVGVQTQITAAEDVKVSFEKPSVITVSAPVPPQVIDQPTTVPNDLITATPALNQTPVQTGSPTVSVPVASNTPITTAPSAPIQQAVPVAAPEAVTSGVDREVYVGLTGFQSVVDLGRGPVLWPLGAGYPPYVAEHDGDGGWARFGSLRPGNTVRMTGLVTGTYTVGQIINVPKGGTTDEFKKFSVTPKVMLQTCIPGTSRMIVVGLY